MSESQPHRAQGGIVGRVLGNYRVTGELSSGGMGTVYRAQHELLGRTAAVKLLRPELTANPELVQRFFNEAKAATAIRHPGIIEVYDFGYTDDGRAYLIMEFLEGEPLGKRIDERGRLPERETAVIVRGIASALTAAHKRGIVHRDLKPDNVFLVPDPDFPMGERPKVLDFGIAKLAESPNEMRHTQTGALMGTPAYMSPEQARAAGEIDHRADLYSLGCIMYELLVGSPPFTGDGAGEIIALQMFGDPYRPSRYLADLSPRIEAVVMKLLEKEPKDRYQTAAELTEELDGLLGNLSATLSSKLAASDSLPKLTLATRKGVAARNESELAQIQATIDVAPRRNLLPFIAAGVTLAIAAFVAVVLYASGGSKAPAAAPPAPTVDKPPPIQPERAVVEQPVTPPPPEPPRPEPPKKQPIQRPTRPVKPDPGMHTDKGSPIEDKL